MNYFEYAFPGKIIVGPNGSEKVSKEISRISGKKESKVLLVTDKNVGKLEIASKIYSSIREEGHEITIFDDITGEPLLSTAESIAESARREKFDAVIGFGGGSCMDMAKMASVASTNHKPVKEYFAFLEDKIENKPIPKILIPTTSGTGSEGTTYAVVIEGKFKNFMTSFRLVADVSVLDPNLVATCPPRQTAGCGLDALSQCIEPYLSLASDAFSDTFALRGMQLIMRSLRNAYHHGSDLSARSDMALGAFYSGIAISTAAGVILGHCISETVGPKYKIAHGLACGLALPFVLKFNMSADQAKVASLLPYLSNDEQPAGVEAKAERVLHLVKKLVEDLDISLALKEYGVDKEELRETATFIAKEQQFNYALPALNPRLITEANMKQLFDNMWNGEI